MTEEKQLYAVATQSAQVGGQPFTQGQVDLIKRTIAKDASDDELKLFLYQCERTGLDPFSRQIHFVSRWSNRDKRKVGVIQIGIDGFRAVADRTGLYAGNDDPVFQHDDAVDILHPATATVTVWKLVSGQRCSFTASARWLEYYPGKENGFMWDKLPHLMLGKVAEALALRKAFPLQLSGLYAPEEMEQAGPVVETVPSAQSHWVDDPKIRAACFGWLKQKSLGEQDVYRLLKIAGIHDYPKDTDNFKADIMAAIHDETEAAKTTAEHVADITGNEVDA